MAFPLAAALGFAGSVIGGISSARGVRAQNRAAAAQAQKQMDFQERMSSTAHQREVIDLRAAGLNPILSGTGGAGSSSPGGAMAPVLDEITPGINTAMSIRRQNQELKNMKMSEMQTLSDIDRMSAQKALINYQANSAQQMVRMNKVSADLAEKLKKLDEKIYSGTGGELLRRAQLLSSPMSSGAGLMRAIQ